MGNRAGENDDAVHPAQPLRQIWNPLTEHLDVVSKVLPLALIGFFQSVQPTKNRNTHTTSIYIGKKSFEKNTLAFYEFENYYQLRKKKIKAVFTSA